MSKILEQTVRDIATKYHQEIEKLTVEQFEQCLLEAIKSGDFVRHIQNAHFHIKKDGELVNDSRYAMTYIPYREKLNQDFAIEKLQKENEILKEAVEFYAETVNWGFIDYDNDVIEHDDLELIGQTNYGGKTARQALQKIKELNNE